MPLSLLKIFVGALALFVAFATLRSIQSGQVSWYSANIAASRSKNPGSFWTIVAIQVAVLAYLVWLVLP
jgi:hypothetical protein